MVQPILACPNPAAWLERIARHTAPDGDCWRWLLGLDRNGYGRFKFSDLQGRRRQTGAHRAAWLAYIGDIPDPLLQVDHLCRNRACVNPWHMDLVTNRVNVLRGDVIGRKKGRSGRRLGQGQGQDGCGKHGLADAYRHVTRDGYERWVCRICAAEGKARYRAREAAAMAW